MQEAKDEFNRLFVGPNSLPAPLWESVYLGKEHGLFEEQTLQVRKCYREYGLVFVRENNSPEDHIVVELEFVSYLIQQTLESNDEKYTRRLIKDQITFFTDHMAKWCLQFCDMLSKASAMPLYDGTARLLREYIELETESVIMLKEAIESE